MEDLELHYYGDPALRTKCAEGRGSHGRNQRSC